MGERTAVVLANGLVGTLAVACVVGVAMNSPLVSVAGGSVLVVVVGLLVRSGRRHVRVTGALAAGSWPGAVEAVAVRWRPFSSHASVAGIWRPTIFCDPALPERLTTDELRAVVLHERYHQQRRDPLRLIVLDALRFAISRLPGGRGWLERRRAELEIRADRHALRHGATRPALASALLKLDGSVVPLAAAGFSTAVELRLRALVDPRAVPRQCRWRAALLAAGLTVTVCAMGASHHMLAEPAGLGCVLAGC